MFRKTFLLFIISLIVISLTACNGNLQTAQAATAESETVVGEPATATYLPTIYDDGEEMTEPIEPYLIVDTGQGICYDDVGVIDCPTEGEVFYGQDAQYTSATFDFTL